MSLNTSKAAAAERSQFNRMAREVPWPLPVKGLLSKAATAEINGQFTDNLHNIISDGISLEFRDGYEEQSAVAKQQRIPFEFGASPGYIEVTSTAVNFGATTFTRACPVDIDHTEISANTVMADGAGAMFRFDGTSFVNCAFTTDTGKSDSEFDGVFSHQDRIYAWDSSELEFYYGGVGAVTGALTRFPLSRLGNITGNIMIMNAVTINAAHGMNDVLAIITSTGWLILYEGLDPGDANDWRLLGRVKVAPPISSRAVISFGSDLWFMTKRGVVSVRDSLARGAMALVSSIAKPISDMLVDEIRLSSNNAKWSIVAREDADQVMINYPSGDTFRQYLLDIASQSWQTTDYPAQWWHALNGNMEFTADDGTLQRLADGGDNDADITATLHTSWIRLGGEMEVAYIIPTIIGSGDLTVKITVLSDHADTAGDITQAQQIVTISPENPGTRVALNEMIGVNVFGRVFQARFEITGRNIRFEQLTAGIA